MDGQLQESLQERQQDLFVRVCQPGSYRWVERKPEHEGGRLCIRLLPVSYEGILHLLGKFLYAHNNLFGSMAIDF
jgi:hypothetical protein